MTTGTLKPLTQGSRPEGRGSMRRVAALARAELALLRRNPLALLTAAVAPVALVLLFRASVPPDLFGGGVGASIVTSLTGATLILVVYYNLVTALVARREELVLKRLRTGELSDAEILAGTAAPAVAIAWGQIAVGVLSALAVFGMQAPTNPLLVLAAIAGGTAVFVLLAVASTALTRTVQTAELTTTPVLVASMTLSGLIFPIDQLPEPLQRLAQALPLTPVVDLLRLGLTGTTPTGDLTGFASSFGPAAVPLMFLAAWLVAGAVAARRCFRWEPRR